ncbi:polysaccharide deacetylase domain protein [Mycobacterium kansasii]|uniref:Polysaccharide deacetylase domain protein n=1 Tax=Mycobacterium kansasii TaxID=1768 RepID=A0A1V3XHE0_MYCKA|nr:polysaccharide deacetylase domain protein [Mycobacterium kansasii]
MGDGRNQGSRAARDPRDLKNFAAGLLCAAGVPTLARRRHRNLLAIVMFHGVESEPLSPACWHVLGSVLYRRQLEYIRKHFNVLPLQEASIDLRRGHCRRARWR